MDWSLQHLKQVAVVVGPQPGFWLPEFFWLCLSVHQYPIGGEYVTVRVGKVVDRYDAFPKGRRERLNDRLQIQITVCEVNRKNAFGPEKTKVNPERLLRHQVHGD